MRLTQLRLKRGEPIPDAWQRALRDAIARAIGVLASLCERPQRDNEPRHNRCADHNEVAPMSCEPVADLFCASAIGHQWLLTGQRVQRLLRQVGAGRLDRLSIRTQAAN
jgi:hypothetical protein